MNIYRHSSNLSVDDGLVLHGYHKKLKTMKKKYFALYKDTANNVARLEYYDNERKFRSGTPPKRTIKLRNCFNINRRLDTRHDFVIALSTKDGGFGIVLDNENDMRKWLEIMISLQKEATSSDDTHPQFGHVWQVTIERRGLAEQKGLIGNYFVGLTSTSLTFIRIGAEKTSIGEKRLPNIEFLLNTIRRCGDSQCYFYIEVGRQSSLGAGEFWMQTEDVLTAQNMHSMILNAMSTKSEASMEPMRKRSSSANEASKPINVLQRRQNQTENKINNSPQTVLGFSRERCDSLPTRNRTSSECNTQNLSATSALSVRTYAISGLRPHSYQRHSNSPPMNATIGCSESEESSVSIDETDDNGSFLSYRFINRSSKGAIPEENSDDLLGVESKSGSIKENIDNDLKPESVSSVGNNDESYLSMAPVYKFKENSVKPEESRFAPSIMEFPEFIFDKMAKNANNDADAQFERPTRAYSIGSKTEHAKFNKRPGTLNNDLNEHNTMRVRAFSVGSRAKIPRCDLQRGVLYPKSLIEHNCNSNNNICSLNDACLTHHMLNTAACSEKKSTSAPILIHHKSQNSVDRMSDLMEIDFSKPTTIAASNNKTVTNAVTAGTPPSANTNASIRIYGNKSTAAAAATTSAPSTNLKSLMFGNREQSSTIMRPDLLSSLPTMPMSIPATTSVAAAAATHTSLHKLSSNFDNAAESQNQSPKTLSPLIEATISQTDNGYLEMKPVGDSLSLSKLHSPAKHMKDTSNLFSATNSLLSNVSVKKERTLQTVPENKNTAKPSMLQQTVLPVANSEKSETYAPKQKDNITAMPDKNATILFETKAINYGSNPGLSAAAVKIDLAKLEKQDLTAEKLLRKTTETSPPSIPTPPSTIATATPQVAAVEYLAPNLPSRLTGKPSKNISDQTNLNILSARYAQLTLNANTNANVNANIIVNQKQNTENNSSTTSTTTGSSSGNDDYINIKRITNEKISAKLKNQLTNNANTICKTKDQVCGNEHARDIKPLTHSISDEDNKYDGTVICAGSGRKSAPSNETGYEILQIKSDSSLQAAHKSYRKDKVQQLTPSRPRSTNSSALPGTCIALGPGSINLSGVAIGSTSSSTSCLNYLPTPSTPNLPSAGKGDGSHCSSPSPTCKTNNASNNPITMVTSASGHNPNQANNNNNNNNSTTNTSPFNAALQASRPPSVCSAHELHYASLDLPPSSSEISVKLNKMDVSNGSSPIAEIASANNSYAKIHFELSDSSSSSSSKNVNN